MGHKTLSRWALLAAAVGAATLLLSACADPGPHHETPAAAAPSGVTTWTTLTAPGGGLAGCSCHIAGSPNGLSLAPTTAAYDALFSTKSLACNSANFVSAWDHANSSLYLVINPPGTGCTAPSMTGFQNAALATELGNWIDAGAPQ